MYRIAIVLSLCTVAGISLPDGVIDILENCFAENRTKRNKAKIICGILKLGIALAAIIALMYLDSV